MESVGKLACVKKRLDLSAKPMNSTQSNVIVLIRICGNTLVCQRKGETLHVRKVGKSTSSPPNQMGLFALLRDEGGAGDSGIQQPLVERA